MFRVFSSMFPSMFFGSQVSWKLHFMIVCFSNGCLVIIVQAVVIFVFIAVSHIFSRVVVVISLFAILLWFLAFHITHIVSRTRCRYSRDVVLLCSLELFLILISFIARMVFMFGITQVVFGCIFFHILVTCFQSIGIPFCKHWNIICSGVSVSLHEQYCLSLRFGMLAKNFPHLIAPWVSFQRKSLMFLGMALSRCFFQIFWKLVVVWCWSSRYFCVCIIFVRVLFRLYGFVCFSFFASL